MGTFNAGTPLAVLFLVMLFTGPAFGQSTWMINDGVKTVALEWVNATFEDPQSSYYERDYEFMSSNFYLSGRYEVKPGFILVGEIPFATYSGSIKYSSSGNQDKEEYSGDCIGNPYIGVEAGNAERTLFVEAGFRLPVIGYDDVDDVEENSNIFTYTSAYEADFERIGAFRDFYIPVNITLNWRQTVSPELQLLFRGGVLNLYQHQKSIVPYYYNFKNENFLVYNLNLRYSLREVQFQAGWGGMYLTGNRTARRTEIAWEHLALSVNVPVKPFNIGLAFRLPLSKAEKNYITNAVHIGIGYDLP